MKSAIFFGLLALMSAQSLRFGQTIGMPSTSRIYQRYPSLVSNQRYPSLVSNQRYPGLVSNQRYPGLVSNQRYPGRVSNLHMPLVGQPIIGQPSISLAYDNYLRKFSKLGTKIARPAIFADWKTQQGAAWLDQNSLEFQRQAYDNYVRQFENTDTKIAKPLNFDAWKVSRGQGAIWG